MSDLVQRDAEEFGVHVKAGGWRLGLLVARNVEKGVGTGRPKKGETVSREKVSAAEFAQQSTTSTARVLRYLSAWEHAAADGLVPPAHALSPGEDIDLDLDKLGDWDAYYPPIKSLDTRAPEHRDAIEKAAAENGTTAEQVQRASASRPALIAAIKADPKTREAVASAIAIDPELSASVAQARQRVEDDITQRRPSSEKRADTMAGWSQLAARFARFRRDVQSDLDSIDKDLLGEETRSTIEEEARLTIAACEMVVAALRSGDWDLALTSLVGGAE